MNSFFAVHSWPIKRLQDFAILRVDSHSGSVLDLPYAFQPTKGGGMIRMQRNMDALANVGMVRIARAVRLFGAFD